MDNQSQSNSISAQRAYQSVFRLLDDAVVVCDAQHQIRYLNPSAERLFNIQQDVAIGQTLSVLFAERYNIDLSLDNIPAHPIKLTINNATRYYHVKSKPLPEDSGQVIFISNITAHYHAQSELNALLAEYGNFAHTVGHDVKSPLGVVIGYSNMLQAELEEGTEARIFSDEIFNTSMRIMYICNELVVLGELQNLKTITTSAVDLKFTFESILRRFESDLNAQGVRLTIPDQMVTVQGNSLWIEETLIAFMRYALTDSSPTTHIEIGSDQQGDQGRFWLRHDGEPIAPDLFDTDVDLDDVRAQGHGLDMPVAKRLIERLGGTMGIADPQTLYFTLPIVHRD